MKIADIKHFNLEITKKCNQKCFYCFNDSGISKKSNELSLDEWKESISDIHLLGYRSVHITGGEPFLHPNIVEILSHSISLELETTILSNGLKIAKLVDENPKLFSKINLAQISIDSMDEEMQNERRGYKNAYKDAFSAINALKKLNIPIEISTTVSEQNLDHIIDIAIYAKSIDASLIIRPLISVGRANNLKHNQNFIDKLNKIIDEIKLKTQVRVINDKFNYVADDKETERYFNECGTITVEATGKLRGIHFFNKNLREILNNLKVA